MFLKRRFKHANKVIYEKLIEMNLEDAIGDFVNGKPVLLFDFLKREGEVDMVYYAGYVDEDSIYRLRTEAGGLICYATSMEVAKQLNLPIMRDILSGYEALKPLVEKTPSYGDPSTFSLWVSHVNTKTGISDKDRALTVKRLHYVVSLASEGFVKEARKILAEEFYFPGHVPILISRGLKHRGGHSELSIALAIIAGLKPSVLFAEMLDKGCSMCLTKAKKFAEEMGLKIIRGEEIVRYVAERGFEV